MKGLHFLSMQYLCNFIYQLNIPRICTIPGRQTSYCWALGRSEQWQLEGKSTGSKALASGRVSHADLRRGVEAQPSLTGTPPGITLWGTFCFQDLLLMQLPRSCDLSLTIFLPAWKLSFCINQKMYILSLLIFRITLKGHSRQSSFCLKEPIWERALSQLQEDRLASHF